MGNRRGGGMREGKGGGLKGGEGGRREGGKGGREIIRKGGRGGKRGVRERRRNNKKRGIYWVFFMWMGLWNGMVICGRVYREVWGRGKVG